MLQLSQTALGDQLQIGHFSHPGLSGKNNEDYYGVFSVMTAGGECIVAAVADGIGGSVGGEQASRLTIRTIAGFLEDDRYAATSLDRRLEQAVLLANREVYNKAQSDPALLGMGTTIVAAALDGDRLHVVHAGDSRAYLVRGGKAWQLTLDHSWAQEAIEAGRITPEAAKTHPNRHVIRRYLGINEDVETDLRVVDPNRGTGNGTRPGAVQAPIQTRPGDTILLCSDGLTDEVGDEEIGRIVSRYAPEEAARRLVDAANAAGGADNITAVILRRGGGKAAAAGGRSPVTAIGLALAALLIVGGLGWLIASGALSGGAGTGVALAPSATPVVLSAATLDATSAPTPDDTLEATPADPASGGTGDEASTAQAATPAATATATAALPTETPPATAETPTATEPAASTSEPATATPQPTSTAVGDGASAPALPAADASSTPVPPTPELLPPPPELPVTSPTSTPVSLSSPSPTVTPTPIPTLTSRPRPSAAAGNATATSTRAAASTTPASTTPASATAASTIMPPQNTSLGKPLNITNVRSSPEKVVPANTSVTISWSSDTHLEVGQCFEVVFWRPTETSEMGQGFFGAGNYESVNISLGKHEPGEYKWAVFLVTCDPSPYGRLRPLSPEFAIRFEGNNNSGSGSSGGSSGGSSSGGSSGGSGNDGSPGGRPGDPP